MKNSTIIAFACMIIALSIGYYFVLFLPQQERQRLELLGKQREAEQARLDANSRMLHICILGADASGSEFWDRECESQGMEKDCRLSSYNADRVDAYTKELKDDCFRKYPQK